MTITPIAELLENCAQALLNRQSSPGQPEHVRSLLKALQYDVVGNEDPVHEADTKHRAKLLRAAAGFARLFQLYAPDAPGLIFFGAEVDPGGTFQDDLKQRRLSATGVGPSFRVAFEGCVGEGIELLSQFESPADGLSRATLAECSGKQRPVMTETLGALLREAGRPIDTAIDWITALRLSDGREAAFPADFCVRRGPRHDLASPWPLSIGCAAGPSFEAAVLHGLLELIERDAAALWWRGGIRGHLIDLNNEALRRATGLLSTIRGAGRRRCWLLDITTDLQVPSVAAISVNQDGYGFACGLAARLSLARAAEAAILEMCQMELAHEVVAAKRRESGDSSLNAHDRAHLRRGKELDPHACELLHPLPPRTDDALDLEAADVATALSQLTAHLDHRGIETFVIDLTRPAFGIPVARVLCPDLEKEPSHWGGSRLREATEITGGGHAHTAGVPLM